MNYKVVVEYLVVDPDTVEPLTTKDDALELLEGLLNESGFVWVRVEDDHYEAYSRVGAENRHIHTMRVVEHDPQVVADEPEDDPA